MKYTVEADADGNYVDEYTGQATKMAVDSMTTVHGDAIAASDYQVAYYSSNADGKFTAADTKLAEAPKDSGNYIIAIYPKTVSPAADLGAYDTTAVIAQEFTIATQTLSDVFAYEVNDDENDVSDTTFAYTGEPLQIGFAKDGKKLEAGTYSAVWSPSAPTDAGTYTVTIVGLKQYAGSKLTLTVEVAKLDISTLVVGDVKYNEATTKALAADNFFIDGEELTNAAFGQLSTQPISAWRPSGNTTLTGENAKVSNSDCATYTYRVTPKDADAEKNITGVAEVTFNGVTDLKTDGDFTYDGKPLSDLTAIDLSEDKPFDPSKLGVAGLSYDDGDFSYTVTKDGQAVTSYDEAGQYVVTVSVKVPGDLSVGGTATQKFTVTKGSVTANSIFVAIDGKNVSSENEGSPTQVATFDGAEHAPSVVVKAGKAVLENGTDYTVEVTTKVDGKDVESTIVNAGTYAIKVTPSAAYGGESAAKTLYASVGKMPVYYVEEANEFGIVWTGDPVTPAFKAINSERTLSFDMTVDEDYTVSYWQAKKDAKGEWVKDTSKQIAYDKIVDPGTYVAEVTIARDSVNFHGNQVKTVVFSVVKSIAFADVAADAWYADSVALASQEAPVKYGYMKGIPGTNLFLPEGTITRAQTAQVLYNMAGGEDAKDGATYPSKFSDVAADAWYALPVLWASEAGIVTGIGDTGTFEPDAAVTREQAATMMYRYVKAQGQQASGSADLSAYADGDAVSGWAAEAMAWAVEAGVFGVGTDVLRPQDTLTRAEMAAISVRVQPDGAIEAL